MVAVLAHLLLKLDMRITRDSQVYHLVAKDIPPCQDYVAGVLSHGGQGHHPCHHSNCFCGGWFLARGAQSNQVVAVALSLVGLRLCLLGGSISPIGNRTSTPMSLSCMEGSTNTQVMLNKATLTSIFLTHVSYLWGHSTIEWPWV